MEDHGVTVRGRTAPELTMGREEMALLVGTTRATLSGSLGRFAERGAVELKNGKIRVLDSSILEGLAE